ncbi:MAG: response regulator [Sphingomonadales bacterium]|nr:response regulator [Sphingomonadales bacterium]MDE2170553.1 response regulator [Sphingomonadales bacterium]
MNLDTSILIVDDDDGIRGLISDFLQKHGYRTATAADPFVMRAMLAQDHYDLIVLDVMMPREDGLTALRQLGPDAPPVIMLSAVGSDIDRIVGLEMGADDYLAKPCNPRELLARIRTVLRRRKGGEGAGTDGRGPGESAANDTDVPVFHFAGWRLDTGVRLLIDPAGQAIALTDGEFRLMRAFAEHPRRVLTRDQLLDWSRGEDSEQFDRAIDVQLSRLRRKLAMGEGGQEIIRTIRNEGYLFQPMVTTR